jgi:hypothetical protein
VHHVLRRDDQRFARAYPEHSDGLSRCALVDRAAGSVHTSGIGRELARALVERGDEVVLTGRDAARAAAVAGEIGGWLLL